MKTTGSLSQLKKKQNKTKTVLWTFVVVIADDSEKESFHSFFGTKTIWIIKMSREKEREREREKY